MEDLNPKCERCGKCCNTYTFWMSNRSYDNDPKEIKRLIEYHGCTPIKNMKGELGISIPMTCQYLAWEGSKSICKIQDKKPVVCKEYYCGKIIEQALKEKLNGVHI